MASNSGWYFEENRQNGFSLDQCTIGGRCECSRPIQCSSGTDNTCSKARRCTDHDGLNRCLSDVPCDEVNFSEETTLYAQCTGSDLASRSTGELRDFGGALKLSLTEVCTNDTFQVGRAFASLTKKNEGVFSFTGPQQICTSLPPPPSLPSLPT